MCILVSRSCINSFFNYVQQQQNISQLLGKCQTPRKVCTIYSRKCSQLPGVPNLTGGEREWRRINRLFSGAARLGRYSSLPQQPPDLGDSLPSSQALLGSGNICKHIFFFFLLNEEKFFSFLKMCIYSTVCIQYYTCVHCTLYSNTACKYKSLLKLYPYYTMRMNTQRKSKLI